MISSRGFPLAASFLCLIDAQSPGVVRWQELVDSGFMTPRIDRLKALSAHRVLSDNIDLQSLPEEVKHYVLNLRRSPLVRRPVLTERGDVPAVESISAYEDALANRYLNGHISAQEYLAAYGAKDDVRVTRHRRVRVLLDKMAECREEGCDATECSCPDGFVAQSRAVIQSVQRVNRQERYPVEFLFVERFEEDFVARPNGTHLYMAIVPPQHNHISRFDARAVVQLDPVNDQHLEALCLVVQVLRVATFSEAPDWMLVASRVRYEWHVYFTYFVYCVCIAAIIYMMCAPKDNNHLLGPTCTPPLLGPERYCRPD